MDLHVCIHTHSHTQKKKKLGVGLIIKALSVTASSDPLNEGQSEQIVKFENLRNQHTGSNINWKNYECGSYEGICRLNLSTLTER